MSNLTFQQFSEINRDRCQVWHPGFPNDAWTGADWSNAMVGEAGEAANVVKKLRRGELSLPSAIDPERGVLLYKLSSEIGDVVAYLDLLAQHYGLDLETCVIKKFNYISIREGMPQRIELP